MFVGVFDHDDRSIHHGPDCDGNAAQAHDVGTQTQHLHAPECEQHTHRQHHNRHKSTSNMQQKNDTHQCNNDALFCQRSLERADGASNKIRAIVHRHDTRTRRQAGQDAVQGGLGSGNDVKCIGTLSLRDNARGHFTLAVQFGDPAPLIRTQFHTRNVSNENRHAVRGTQHDLGDVFGSCEIASSAHRKFCFAQFNDAAANIAITARDGFSHVIERDAHGQQTLGVDDHIVLLDKPAHA